MVSFLATREESAAIMRIVRRYEAVTCEPAADRLALAMDLTAAHANGCPLDFAKLENFADADLIHDVAGIKRHLDRETGKLRDCFLPRCAKAEG